MDHRGQLLTVLIWSVVLGFTLIYVIEEIRGFRTKKRSPLLGVQVLLCLLISLGLQFFLLGLTVGLANMFGPNRPEVTAFGFGICAGGALAMVLPALLYWFLIRSRTTSDILHKALGINSAIAGIASGLMVTATVLALMQGRPSAVPALFTLIYTVALLVSALPLLLAKPQSSEDDPEESETEDYSSLNPLA
jgi:hypothetical protein